VSITWQREVAPETGFARRVIADLGATMAAGAVVLGDRLGLYRALASGPMRPLELARRTGTSPRYVEEWLRGQAAGGYVEYDPEVGEFWMTPEQIGALADPSGSSYAPAAFEHALGALLAQPRIEAVFRSGGGIGWHEHDSQVFDGMARVQEARYVRELVPTWLPALTDVVAKLEAGGRVADVPSLHAATTMLMARYFPASRFTAFDCYAQSVGIARGRVADAGLTERITVEEFSEHCLSGGPYDLITTFEALHDLGDPVGLARQVAGQLAPDGVWMIVEPIAGATVTDNLTATGRLYYTMSIFLCVPNALAREGGHSLGAQAGEEPIRRVVTAAGFGHFRRVAETELSVVYEVRHA
jgi:2-polyprenyl-3-methyl-5-hydroxy-6-metoxy-1,4-benzoquinol methylase